MKLTFPEGEEIRWVQRPFATKYPDGMAEYLYVISMGGNADEVTGEVDWHYHVSRFGKRLLFADDQGFVWVVKYDSEAEAVRDFELINTEYGEWCDQEDEG